MLRFFLLLCLLFAGPALAADPWVISGQTRVEAGTGMDNPTPAAAGAEGQVTALPYTVPPGNRVCVTAYGMEGYDEPGIAVLFVWTGAPAVVTSEWRIDHGLPSVAASNGSQEITGMNFCFSAGTVLNVRLINGQTSGSVYGWYVAGEIEVAP